MGSGDRSDSDVEDSGVDDLPGSGRAAEDGPGSGSSAAVTGDGADSIAPSDAVDISRDVDSGGRGSLTAASWASLSDVAVLAMGVPSPPSAGGRLERQPSTPATVKSRTATASHGARRRRTGGGGAGKISVITPSSREFSSRRSSSRMIWRKEA